MSENEQPHLLPALVRLSQRLRHLGKACLLTSLERLCGFDDSPVQVTACSALRATVLLLCRPPQGAARPLATHHVHSDKLQTGVLLTCVRV